MQQNYALHLVENYNQAQSLIEVANSILERGEKLQCNNIIKSTDEEKEEVWAEYFDLDRLIRIGQEFHYDFTTDSITAADNMKKTYATECLSSNKKQKDKTKVLIHKQVRNLPNFNSSVEKFRDQIKSRIRSINAIKIFNTDQMGVNIELLSKRTLEVCGSKQVVSTVENSMKILYSIDNFEIYLFKFNQYMLRRTFV